MENSEKNTTERYALVTGAYGGMGRATSLALAASGFKVFALDRTVGEAEANIYPIEVDLTNETAVIAAIEKVREVTSSLYAVVHFAGVYTLDSLVEIDTAEFDKVISVNLRAAFLVNKECAKMLEKGGKILVTTSELAPLDPLPFTGLYAVSKKALDAYAYSLRMELQLLGISVSVLRAGAVSTGMLGASTAALDRFCNKTELYSCNAARFKKIVDGVESKSVPPEKIAAKTIKILAKKRPRFAYSINRNGLLRLLGVTPKRLQFACIRRILR